LTLLTDVVSGFKSFNEAPRLHRSVVPVGVTIILGLCNPPRRGRGEPAKPQLLYLLVWIPRCDTVSEKLGSRSTVGSIVDDLESWVTCCDRQD
jgi:hypothetical protein